ncbi:nuclear transport factor 2 family protein [Winogradskyella sp. A3E31]|uniref:nuclear transport factor 2 family protein n=1 Tax=Winogradskyella sp. A3E31 TaxID=3349637 RepID=UPI00398BB0D0
MKNTITQFYTAFSNLDAEKMNSLYHDDIVFNDPAFGTLKGDRVKYMWQMLCEAQVGKGFKIEFSDVMEDAVSGTAHWEADYIFSRTGRKVHNEIDAEFKIKDGKIIEHTDRFNLQKWASQALGVKGAIMGGTGYFKRKLQFRTKKMLEKYIEEQKD